MFDWENPYSTVRSPLFARNVVATSHPLAAQAGLTMIANGGNAVDAAIAAAAAMTIVEPVSNGLGSDLFALVWDPARTDGRALHGLNASGVAPAAWNVDYFRKKYGEVFPLRGWDTVTVPGAVAGWAALSERFGTLPFADLLAPAVDLAARGYGVSTIVAQKWAAQVPGLHDQPGYAAAFMPNGRAPQPGERFVFADAARTLTAIAETRGASFYEGAIGERIIAHSKACGGVMTSRDLADYRVDWVDPIMKSYVDRHGVEHSLHEIPPNGQGIAALMALGMAGHLDLASHPVDSVEAQHLLIEAMKLAFADVYRYVADARHMSEVTAEHLLDDGYLAERARSIDPDRAGDFTHGLPHQFVRPGGTIYLTTADASGMMVSLIQSNYMGFGSGVVVPGTGVSLQNRGHGFSLDPGHPNVVAGGKRPFHTIIPGFLTRTVVGSSGPVQVPQMSFGVMGGNMQPQGHLQTLVRMLTYGQQPQAACDAPRWKVGIGLSVDCEKTMSSTLRDGLVRRGHRIESIPDAYMDFGSGQFIWKLSDDPLALPGFLVAERGAVGRPGPEVLEDDAGGVCGRGRAARRLEGAVGGRGGGDFKAARLADLTLDVDEDRLRVPVGDVDHVAVAEGRVSGRRLVVEVGAVVYDLLVLGAGVGDLDLTQIGIQGWDRLLQDVVQAGVRPDDVVARGADQAGHVYADAALLYDGDHDLRVDVELGQARGLAGAAGGCAFDEGGGLGGGQALDVDLVDVEQRDVAVRVYGVVAGEFGFTGDDHVEFRVGVYHAECRGGGLGVGGAQRDGPDEKQDGPKSGSGSEGVAGDKAHGGVCYFLDF